MRKPYLLLLFVFCLLALCYACSTSYQSYEAPERKDLGNNEYEYVNSPLYEGSEAGAFDPELGSPEAAVAKFLSSQARGDSAWKGALVPEAEWPDRLKSKLEDWAEWKILKWQLKALQMDDSRAYITVYFEIEYDGDTDDGEDEFELVRKNGVWMVLYPPT